MKPTSITLCITGASGVQYGLRLLECLLSTQVPVKLLISSAAQVVAATETELKLSSKSDELRTQLCQLFNAPSKLLNVYNKEQWMAPIASGSACAQAMVVCPCSSATLSAIACGASNNLIERAADVTLKEHKKLILVTRETPVSVIHLENMLKLARMGVVIMPASPGFYHKPTTVEQLVDFVVARVLDHLEIEQQLIPKWGEESV